MEPAENPEKKPEQPATAPKENSETLPSEKEEKTAEKSVQTDRIIPRVIEQEMKQSYLDYAMSVIVGRALPDVRDGLKPVHRRILFAMHGAGQLHNKPYKKSAHIVGKVLGELHPHGDAAVYDTMVRMAQDFSLRYPLLDGHGNWGCFTGDTKIKLADGRSLSFKELIKEYKEGKRNYTYTFNQKEEQIEIAEIKNPRLTKKNAEIMKIILNDNQEIRCTLNHRFMLRDGSYIEAQHLNAGDSLMAGYFKLSEEKQNPDMAGYLLVHQPITQKWSWAHRLADAWNIKQGIYAEKKGMVRHHADFNKLNNFNNFDEMLEEASVYNHSIASIEFLKTYEDVYDLTIDDTHNFLLDAGVFVHNSIDGDSAAAYRYTEVRLKKIAEELLADIEKDTVDFQPNFDGSLKEPMVLPAKLPNLLINGSSGIAVGMATNIPPHNLNEVADAAIALIDRPELSIPELMQHIKGPDFPTGALIAGTAGIREAYETGHGKVVMKGKAEIVELKKRNAIIVTEIPYMINKSQLIEEIAGLVRDKRITGISDIRDESNKEGIRIVFELKKDAQPNVVKNQLFTYSRLATTFGINMLALVNSEPVVLNVKQMISHYITYRQQVVRRRTAFELRKAEERKHILEGLIIALNAIDDVVRKIKASKTVEDAHRMLIADYSLSDMQAKAILEMRLQKLASLEQEKIKQEHRGLLTTIAELKSILASEPRILSIIKEELEKLKQEYGDERRTIIEHAEGEVVAEALIKKEEVAVTISHKGYVKRTPLTEYRSQSRGGIGVKAAETGEDDYVQDLFVASTHSYLLVFTNKGRVHWLKVHELPEASRQARGKAFVNVIPFRQDEKVNTVVPVKEFDDQHYVLFATKQGTVKKTNLNEFSRQRAGGIAAINLDGDELVNVILTDGKQQVFIATANGSAVRFDENNVRPMGRTASGVRGIELRDNEGKIIDAVIGMILVDENKSVLTITENGYGKRTAVEEYRLIRRGGSGVINIQASERNGKVVAIDAVTDEDELIVISQDGTMIRIPCRDISIIGRNTQGVRIMKLREGDKVVSATKVARE